MNRAIAIASLVVGAGWATTASADSPQIKGAYAFTGSAACLVAPGGITDTNTNDVNPTPGVQFSNAGFDSQLRVKDVTHAFNRSFSVEGIRTFDGNGNGTVKGTAVGILYKPTPGPTGYPHFPPSASSGDFSFQFTYTVNGDGSWTATMVPGTYTETFATGPRTGQTATVDAIPPVTGVISQDGKTLIAAHLAPSVETRTFFDANGNPGDVWPEVCHRSREFIKLQNDDGNGH
jgi:hypothetical protein